MSATQIETGCLPNGLLVAVAPRGAVPLVGLRLGFPSGAAVAGPRRSGLAELVLGLLRRGAKGRSAHAIDEALETLGCDLATGVDDDALRLGLAVPSDRLAPALALLLDLATAPTFPDRELGNARARQLASVRSSLDDPGSVAERALHVAAFGGHPYGDPIDGWSRDVRGLRRPAAVEFHRSVFRGGGACLVAAGGVGEGLLRRLEREGRKLPSGGGEAAVSPPPPIEGRRVLVVDKPDAQQAHVRIVAPGPRIDAPDLVAALVGNVVLGGGFSSRLVDEVRVARGLAYGVGSRFHPRHAAGLFAVRSSTRVAETAQLVGVCLDEIARLRDGGPTDAELAQARAYLAGSFLVGNETGEQVAATLAASYLEGLGLDWIDRFPRLVMEAERPAVAEALQRHLPGPCRVVVVGPAKALERPLRRFGPVEVVPLARML